MDGFNDEMGEVWISCDQCDFEVREPLVIDMSRDALEECVQVYDAVESLIDRNGWRYVCGYLVCSEECAGLARER